MPSIEFTGERFLPGAGADITYEHLSRYMMASRFCEGKNVVDIPSGEGFGTEILSRSAAFALGIDIDSNAVGHAQAKYAAANLKYKTGSLEKLEEVPDASVDVVVCFEGIEHVDERIQGCALKEFARILKHDGLLLISTPNKKTYSDDQNYKNEYHVREFYFDEFRDFLSARFPYLFLMGQKMLEGSLISPISSMSPSAENKQGAFSTNGFILDQLRFENGTEKGGAMTSAPDDFMYILAICSRAPLRVPLEGHVLADLDRSSREQAIRSFHEYHHKTLGQSEARFQSRLVQWAFKTNQLLRAIFR